MPALGVSAGDSVEPPPPPPGLPRPSCQPLGAGPGAAVDSSDGGGRAPPRLPPAHAQELRRVPSRRATCSVALNLGVDGLLSYSNVFQVFASPRLPQRGFPRDLALGVSSEWHKHSEEYRHTDILVDCWRHYTRFNSMLQEQHAERKAIRQFLRTDSTVGIRLPPLQRKPEG